jgi:phage recombination protein Bet
VNALTRTESTALALSDDELIATLRNSLYPGAKAESVKLAIGYCRAAKLDPIQKPVHIVPMYVEDKQTGRKEMRDVIMPGVGLYRTQAARSGQYGGISEPEYGPDIELNLSGVPMRVPEWCKVTVYRIEGGEPRAFVAKEFWIENYATAGRDTEKPNAMWKKRPRGQIAKCAEAQALRRAFPEFGAAPTAEEMEGKTFDVETIDAATGEVTRVAVPSAPTLPVWPAEAFAMQIERYTKAVHAGLKTVDDILAMARSKGVLTPEQEAQIKAIKKPEPAAEADPFVTDMEQAEGSQQ